MTVLAYGQTGSGKTFSMGTCPSSNQTDIGIIPRAIADIFDVINNDDQWIFKVSVSFLEVCLILIISGVFTFGSIHIKWPNNSCLAIKKKMSYCCSHVKPMFKPIWRSRAFKKTIIPRNLFALEG